jgi:hypothetical protein
MEVNYTKYSYQELLEVKGVIDKQKYPERYQRLLNEIELRIKNGETSTIENSEMDDDDASVLWDSLVVYNFNNRYYRIAFGLFYALVSVALLTQILPAFFHTKLANLPAYETTVDNIECKQYTFKQDGKNYTEYDLKVVSYGFTFYVIDMKASTCKNTANRINKGEKVTIWYDGDLIYQLARQNDVVLPYQYLKRYVWHAKVNNSFSFIIGFILFVSTFFRSFVNCITPQTYVPNKDD